MPQINIPQLEQAAQEPVEPSVVIPEGEWVFLVEKAIYLLQDDLC